jgi:serine/threonine protein kinase/Tfp pilus assembly protein PilF
MKPERWQQIDRLLEEALERPPAQRAAFLDEACAGDEELRREVEAVLQAHQQAGSFLAAPALEAVAKAVAREQAQSLTGRRLSHYQVLSLLGAGGMGEVYRAQDTRLDRTVALKVLPAEVAADQERMQRFIREAKAASALNHPNVATIYDIGEAEGISFIAMEYIEGETLAARIKSRPLAVNELVEVGFQVADALDAAHSKGITHRDIKPANLMLTLRGQVKVLDFGLAKISRPEAQMMDSNLATASGTLPGMVLGTVQYMSPEQVLGREVDHRSDIFSLGVTLYEMATGRLPFAGATVTETMDRVLHAPPEAISRLNQQAPGELERIVRKCLEKERERRYQSARELLVDLKNLQRDSGAEAAVFERTALPRWSQRRRLVLTGGLALGMVALSGSVWWLVWSRAGGTVATSITPARPRLSSGGPASANPEANRLFENAMQGKVVNDLPKTRQMLEQALALDPHFAEARAWYGFTNWLRLDQGYSNDSTLLNEAEAELRRALQDDPTLARAHASFAAIYMMQGRKEYVPGEVAQAVKTNPGDEDASQMLMLYHQYNGDYDTAKRVGQEVLDRLPLFFPNRMVIGEMLRQEGDLDGAVREQKKILEQDPQNMYALGYLARTYLDAGDLLKARQTLERIRPEEQQSYRTRRTRAILLALEGRRAEALKEMDGEVLKWEALYALETSEVADFYAVLGDASQALHWLNEAVSKGDERDEWFRRDPLLANIRSDPRFQQILQSIAQRRQQRKPLR